MGKQKCFQLAFESIDGINLKWWRQIVPSMWSSHSERAESHTMWHLVAVIFFLIIKGIQSKSILVTIQQLKHFIK